MIRHLLPALALLAAAPASAQGVELPGTGWSRAPDLSVYAALSTYSQVAREQEVLCLGFSPLRVNTRWRRSFGVREDRVTSTLQARYGVTAVAFARDDLKRTIPCNEELLRPWRAHYVRLLRVLEVRLGLA